MGMFQPREEAGTVERLSKLLGGSQSGAAGPWAAPPPVSGLPAAPGGWAGVLGGAGGPGPGRRGWIGGQGPRGRGVSASCGEAKLKECSLV